MRKHTVHKILTIMVLLAAFCIPFYIERSQISSFNDNAYMVGAVINNNKVSSSLSSQDKPADNQISVWANAAGSTFVDAPAN
ncbi:MAG TPA: hypothetical protein VMQ52_03405 [Candidatus Saccharimonadales bacterium]|jgi:hypothetical protein|nr:hypothetical protein [Candidatus Saccharimonadales bacterium]